MKVAVIGSRNIEGIDIEEYVPCFTSEIISGGAVGIDNLAKAYAEKAGIKYTEILPDYKRYGRGAPIVRNKQIVDLADEVVAIWNGKSKGTASVIDYCKKKNIKCTVYIMNIP